MVRFRVLATSGRARAGVIETPHGEVPTPAFMPVATQASVKALAPQEVLDSGAHMLIANTYHLWLRPGPEVVAAHGGLHAFARWPRALATDSGGFQAFSLAERTRVSEDGFEFASHLDGQRRQLSPEESMRVQGLLGADIAMQLDVCPPAGAERAELEAAVARTTRWAERCLCAKRPEQALFGIVQGGTLVDLRVRHAETLARLPLAGLALGGLSVGEPRQEMYRTILEVTPELDAARPRYLMGVGMPRDLLQAMGAGNDLFDCVIPTRNARNGRVFVPSGTLNIKNAEHQGTLGPLDPACTCPVCRDGGYSRSYLRHLYQARELFVYRLLTQHNLHYFGKLMADARRAILEDRYESWASDIECAFRVASPT